MDTEVYATITQSDDKLTFHLDADKLPTKSGTAYSHYAIFYVMKVKDQDTLKDMMAESLEASDHKVTMTNTAEAGGFTAEASVDYSYAAVEKTLDSTFGGSQDGTARAYATYTVKVNAAEQDLDSSSDTLTL